MPYLDPPIPHYLDWLPPTSQQNKIAAILKMYIARLENATHTLDE